MLDYEQSAPTLDVGGRILRSIVRPYPAKTAGIPLKFQYEINTGEFTFEWAIPDEKSELPEKGKPLVSNPPRAGHPTLTSNVTEIYLPWLLAQGTKVAVRGLGPGDEHRYEPSQQTLLIITGDNTPGKVHKITVSLSPRPRSVFPVNDIWSDFGGQLSAAGVLVFALIAYILAMFW